MHKPLSFTLAGALLCAAALAAHDHGAEVTAAPAAGGDPSVIDVPAQDVGAATLAARALAERNTLGSFEVPIDFRFTDRAPESGITFVHQIVDDVGKTYKPAHYDHGNGVAAADVDGDGRVDLYFTSQLGRNELWLNDGGGKFHDGTAAARVGMDGRISVSASFADIDNDGDEDLYVTTVRHGNALFENDGKGHFRDISQAAGVDYVGHSSGAVFFDYDGDGKLDLFLVNVGGYTLEEKGPGGYYLARADAFQGHLHPDRTEYSVLYRNLGGNRFADVSEQAGLHDGSWSGDALVTDFNGDGRPDLYVLDMQGDNHYYENTGGHFVDKTAATFPQTPWGAMGGKAFDYDDDGDLDLLVTDMHSDMIKESAPEEERMKIQFEGEGAKKFFDTPENNVFGNAFWINEGNGKFREASMELGLENYWPWGISVDDLNADGWRDVFITASMNYPWRYGVNSLLINNRGKRFLDAEMLVGIEPRREGRTRKDWFTLDCSGADQAHKLCAGRTGKVTVTGTLGSRSSVIFDLDDDGDLDIVTNELNDRPMVLVSDLAQRRPLSWLKVRLVGTKSNRDGIGAEVVVKADGRTQTALMDGATGYLAHGVLPLYFGLGDAKIVDSVEVRWPSGARQTAPGPIVPNHTIEVREVVPPPGR
ncbi:MAG TPA: CRTAC1 family protein [Thermoanaerobaculia bacterium]|jgi:hypothetical protein|nr:CRTAC1 family protein [Thermoanaerobaculia bacterium]